MPPDLTPALRSSEKIGGGDARFSPSENSSKLGLDALEVGGQCRSDEWRRELAAAGVQDEHCVPQASPLHEHRGELGNEIDNRRVERRG
jgi:hypothetical protein